MTTGEIQLTDNSQPPLPAGTYQVTVTQETQDPTQSPPVTYSFPLTQTFYVGAPRFSLDPTLINSLYPPSNSQDDYTGSLAHVVFNTAALPWLRALTPPVALPYPPPWMAVLLFDSGELIGGTGATQAQTTTVGQALDTNGGTICVPQIDTTTAEQALTCQAIEMAVSTFTAIAPDVIDLPWQAHTRQVASDSKDMGAVNSDGTYGVLFGNRLPQPSATSIVHLVSLEGVETYLPCNGVPGTGLGSATNLRLFSLASWTFACADPAGSFETLAQNVAQTAGLLQMPPGQPGPTEQQNPAVHALVTQALTSGYVPLNYTTRQGEQTVAWYRGPFSPIPTQRDLTRAPYRCVEDAMLYDPNTGMFDQSYAVAWQIGRLLALADNRFSTALLQWRQGSFSATESLNGRLQLAAFAAPHLTAPETVAELAQPRVPHRMVATFLHQELSPRIAPEDASDPMIPIVPALHPAPHPEGGATASTATVADGSEAALRPHPTLHALLEWVAEHIHRHRSNEPEGEDA